MTSFLCLTILMGWRPNSETLSPKPQNSQCERVKDPPVYSQVGMTENVTPSEGTLVTSTFYYIKNNFHCKKYEFSRLRGPCDLLRFSTVSNLTVITIIMMMIVIILVILISESFD